jgi:hypothetical protein
MMKRGTGREYFIGLDLGQKRDYSAVAVVERWQERAGWSAVHFCDLYEKRMALRLLERVQLGTSYMRVCERVKKIAARAQEAGECTVIVDATGVGAPVVDALRDADLGCELTPVTITGGARASSAQAGWNVPKKDLTAAAQLALSEGGLAIAAGLRPRRVFVEELMNFGRGGSVHDDLVMAVALACWKARGRGTVGERGERFCY